MSDRPASRIIEGAREALSIAKGEQAAASITINGHKYVPADAIEALRRELAELKKDEFGFGNTVGSTAVAHLREMYRAAYDALGSSGRVSLRNVINSRVKRELTEVRRKALMEAAEIAKTFGTGTRTGEAISDAIRAKAAEGDGR